MRLPGVRSTKCSSTGRTCVLPGRLRAGMERHPDTLARATQKSAMLPGEPAAIEIAEPAIEVGRTAARDEHQGRARVGAQSPEEIDEPGRGPGVLRPRRDGHERAVVVQADQSRGGLAVRTQERPDRQWLHPRQAADGTVTRGHPELAEEGRRPRVGITAPDALVEGSHPIHPLVFGHSRARAIASALPSSS